MKKIFFISLLTAGLLFHAACTDEVTYDQEQYKSVVHLKESGVVNIDFYNIGQDVSFETCITKGGTDPSVAGDVSLVKFTEEELEIYNQGYGSDFKLLPEGYYTMPDKVSFEANQEATNIKIVLKANIGELDDDISYILPIRLESENHNVYSFKNSLLLHPKVITPTVSLDAIGVQTVTMYDYPTAAGEVTYETGLTLDFFNEWEFKVKLVNDWNKLDELVQAYNTANGTDYKTLPANNYTIPSTIEFGSDESSKGLSVQLKKAELNSEKEYLLPVALNGIEGVPFDVSDQILYIRLHLTKELPKVIIKEDMVSTNSYMDTDSQGQGTVTNVINGMAGRYWQSQNKEYPGRTEYVNDETYGVYIDYDLSKGDILLQTLVKIELWVRSKGYAGGTIPKIVRLYGGTNSNDLQPLSEEIIINDNDIETRVPKPNTTPANVWASEPFEITKEITYLRFSIIKNQKGHDLRLPSWNSASVVELDYYGL